MAPIPSRNPRISNAPASHVAPRRHPSHTTPPSCHQEENGLHPEHHPLTTGQPTFRLFTFSNPSRARACTLAHACTRPTCTTSGLAHVLPTPRGFITPSRGFITRDRLYYIPIPIYMHTHVNNINEEGGGPRPESLQYTQDYSPILYMLRR